MSLVKETGSCARDNVLDEVTTQPVTAKAQTIDAIIVRLVKFPPFRYTSLESDSCGGIILRSNSILKVSRDDALKEEFLATDYTDFSGLNAKNPAYEIVDEHAAWVHRRTLQRSVKSCEASAEPLLRQSLDAHNMFKLFGPVR